MQLGQDTFPAGFNYRIVTYTPSNTYTYLPGQVCSQEAVTPGLLITSASVLIHSFILWDFIPFTDPIDIVKDYIPPHEYLAEEDPKLYQSFKTKRGPLSDDWIEEINQNSGQSPVMCAYKLCKVEFRYWGMQSKIERFIHDVGRYGRWCVYCTVLSLPLSVRFAHGLRSYAYFS